MKITLASLDHFWLIDQARILLSQGYLDHFFTTRIRPSVDGIVRERGSHCYPLHYGLRIMQRWPKLVGGNRWYLQLCRAFDLWLRSKFSRDTDILSILSGVGLRTFRAARAEGVVTVVECGSTHTDFQNEIVSGEFKRNGLDSPLFPDGYRNRIRKEFEESDFIQIPSSFVGRTFIDRGISPGRLLYATYGVNCTNFSPRLPLTGTEPFRAICPSGVNLRKGARVLIQAWRKLGWPDAELHWIGSPNSETNHLFSDLPTSVHMHPWLSHVDLAALYRKCDVLVLPSFEEGFARVMLEAAASGLPLIVTPNTGAEDFFTDPPEGWLIPTGSIDALCNALSEARKDRDATFKLGTRAAARAQHFTWEAYGERVIANYRHVLNQRKS